MPSNIFHLVYSSAALTKMDLQQINAILEVARAFNKSRGITGLLVYRDGRFLQLLEGREEDVRSLVEKIKRDPRHRDFKLLAEFESEAAIFSVWNMAYLADELKSKMLVDALDKLLARPLKYVDRMDKEVIALFRAVTSGVALG